MFNEIYSPLLLYQGCIYIFINCLSLSFSLCYIFISFSSLKLSNYLSLINLSIYKSIYLSIYLSNSNQSIYLSFFGCIYLSICLSLDKGIWMLNCLQALTFEEKSQKISNTANTYISLLVQKTWKWETTTKKAYIE